MHNFCRFRSWPEAIRKVDVEKRKERFDWRAVTGLEQPLIPQQRALSEISPMSAAGLPRR